MRGLPATANLWRRMPTGTSEKQLHLRRSSVDVSIFSRAFGNYIKYRKIGARARTVGVTAAPGNRFKPQLKAFHKV